MLYRGHKSHREFQSDHLKFVFIGLNKVDVFLFPFIVPYGLECVKKSEIGKFRKPPSSHLANQLLTNSNNPGLNPISI